MTNGVALHGFRGLATIFMGFVIFIMIGATTILLIPAASFLLTKYGTEIWLYASGRRGS